MESVDISSTGGRSIEDRIVFIQSAEVDKLWGNIDIRINTLRNHFGIRAVCLHTAKGRILISAIVDRTAIDIETVHTLIC